VRIDSEKRILLVIQNEKHNESYGSVAARLVLSGESTKDTLCDTARRGKTSI
jgi:hypothetical protein